MIATFFQGLLVSLGLIAAIGSQNAFVLRQGLRREHVGWVVLACALSDAILISAGVAGMGALVASMPMLELVMRWIGAAFLFTYGALRFKAALKGGEALVPAEGQVTSLAKVLVICLTLTWANPHVYLDTVLLLGTISAQYSPHHWVFGAGAMMGSLLFFTALGFGARLLAPVFRQPRAWVVLEIIIGCTMWAIALGLVTS